MSVHAAVLDAISPIVSRAAENIAHMVAKMVAARVEAEVRDRVQIQMKQRTRGVPKRRARRELTRWTADRRARRVPTFVIEMTGLDTKKKIVAKFGEDAAFENGKPLPRIAEKNSAESKPEVKARAPIVRKKGKAAA